jgi:hypothetical protein
MTHGAFMYNNFKKSAENDDEPKSLSSIFALEEKIKRR